MTDLRYPDMRRRPGTMDGYVIAEVRTYEKLGIRPGDRVLDVGANIGAFTRMAAEAGASLVVAVEPEPDNIAEFEFNAQFIPTGTHVELVAAAAVTGGPDLVTLYLTRGPNKGAHSLARKNASNGGKKGPIPPRLSIEVPTVEWTDLLAEGFDVIKVDIEGGEYGLDWTRIPNGVRALAVELHLSHQAWWKKDGARVVAEVEAQGFIQVPPTAQFILWRRALVATFVRPGGL